MFPRSSGHCPEPLEQHGHGRGTNSTLLAVPKFPFGHPSGPVRGCGPLPGDGGNAIRGQAAPRTGGDADDRWGERRNPWTWSIWIRRSTRGGGTPRQWGARRLGLRSMTRGTGAKSTARGWASWPMPHPRSRLLSKRQGCATAKESSSCTTEIGGGGLTQTSRARPTPLEAETRTALGESSGSHRPYAASRSTASSRDDQTIVRTS